jgi:hypothetical protein
MPMTDLEKKREKSREYYYRRGYYVRAGKTPPEKAEKLKMARMGRSCADCKHCKVSMYHDGCAYCELDSNPDNPIDYYCGKSPCVRFISMIERGCHD